MHIRTNPVAMLTLVALSALGWGSSCQQNAASTKATLAGQWVIQSALREDLPTETLSGVYFTFSENGTMFTNLPVGLESPVPFELRDQQIFQQSRPPLQYTIQSLSDSTLVLQTTIQEIPFEFRLKRGVPEEVPTLPAPAGQEGEVVNDTVR